MTFLTLCPGHQVQIPHNVCSGMPLQFSKIPARDNFRQNYVPLMPQAANTGMLHYSAWDKTFCSASWGCAMMTSRVDGNPEGRFREHAVTMIRHAATSTGPHCLEFKDSPLPITWIRIIVMLIGFGVAQSARKMNTIDSWLGHSILRFFQTGCIYTSSYKTGDFSHKCKGVRSVKLTNISILRTQRYK